MTDNRTVPSVTSVLMTLIGLTWRRLSRSKAVWVAAIIAGLPLMVAVAMGDNRHVGEMIELAEYLVLILLPPMFVAASLGEEIEDRTTTYLWSRPLPRWSIVMGKLIALAPIAAALVAGGWMVAMTIGTKQQPPMSSVAAFACGALTISALSAGLATLIPKHGMAVSIVYLVVFDLPVGLIPASLQKLSITYQVRMMSGMQDAAERAAPLIGMALIAAFWLAISLWRIDRLES